MRMMFWTALWIFLLDQLVKLLVLFGVFRLSWAELTDPFAPLPYPRSVDVISPYLELHMAWNRGVNFGLFANYDMSWVLIGVAITITAGVIWWLARVGGSKWVYLSGGFLIGGAMGNVIDRILYGAVADFLNMSCCGFSNPYSFNVADICIFIGAIGLAFLADDKKKSA